MKNIDIALLVAAGLVGLYLVSQIGAEVSDTASSVSDTINNTENTVSSGLTTAATFALPLFILAI
jgi:hypothetical protein